MHVEQRMIIFNNGKKVPLREPVVTFSVRSLSAIVLLCRICFVPAIAAIHSISEPGLQMPASHRLFPLRGEELKGERVCRSAREVIDTQLSMLVTVAFRTLRK